MEADKGRLAAGQLADMVILDHNIFNVSPEEVRDTLPVRTIVGGRTVFSA
jgi:predicted amidohydrolase YtcJ